MSWFARRRAVWQEAGRSEADQTRTAEWTAWRSEVYGDGYEVWRNGGPLGYETTAKWIADRAGTEGMLLVGLAADDDATAVAIEDLAAAGHTPGVEVVAALVAACGDDRPLRLRIAALRACWIVTHDPVFVHRLVERLLDRRVLVGRSAAEDARGHAAIALRDVPPTAEVADALADAVAHDGEYGVRYHAASTLLRLAGRDPGAVGLPRSMVEIVSERGSPAGRSALARDLRAQVRTTG